MMRSPCSARYIRSACGLYGPWGSGGAGSDGGVGVGTERFAISAWSGWDPLSQARESAVRTWPAARQEVGVAYVVMLCAFGVPGIVVAFDVTEVSEKRVLPRSLSVVGSDRSSSRSLPLSPFA